MPDSSVVVLNHLVEVCRNGEFGFREAAAAVKDAHLRTTLGNLSEQREQFAVQLRYQVARLGGKPENRGSVAGSFHRRWIELRSSLSTHPASAVLVECERGEVIAERAYAAALADDLPPNVRAIVEDQYTQIKAAHDNLLSLQVRLRQQPAF